MYVQDKLREHFLQSGIQDRMFKLSDPSLEISKQKLQDLRGKMIVLFSYDAGKVNASEGVFRYSENMKVHDRYSNTNNLFDMEEDQLDKWYNIGLHNDKDQMFLLSWTLTLNALSILTGDIETNAKSANTLLPSVLHGWIRNMGREVPNIVYIDYIDKRLGAVIVQYNFEDIIIMPKIDE